MESTSVSAGLATLSTFAADCGDRLRHVVDVVRNASASSEFSALSNEISDFRAVLSEVEATHRTIVGSTAITSDTEDADALILYLLQRAHQRLVQLNGLILSSVKLRQHNELVFLKAVWLRKRVLSSAMTQDLRGIKQNLTLLIASKTA